MSDLGGTKWQADDLLEALSKVEHCRITKGLRDQRNSKGQAAFAETGGEGDCREVQQVYEVGIEAEIGVESRRLGCHRCDLVIGAGGG